MDAGSDVDGECRAEGEAQTHAAEIEQLFRDLVALIGRAGQAVPAQARDALQRAVLDAADAAHAELGRRAATAAAATPTVDLACLDPWRTGPAARRRPRAAPAATRHPAAPAGPYDSAGEWVFL